DRIIHNPDRTVPVHERSKVKRTHRRPSAAETATIEYSEKPVDCKILKKRRKKSSSLSTIDNCTGGNRRQQEERQQRRKRRDTDRQRQRRTLNRQLRRQHIRQQQTAAINYGQQDAGCSASAGRNSNTSKRFGCCIGSGRNHSNGPVRCSANGSRRNMTTDTRRRVKLYALNADRQWDDRGTGHVTSSYVDRVKGVSLLVHAENDGSMLLESKIHPDTTYHKQQDTLIVWSEGDNFDLALSFQEKAGCDEIWEKICQVQGKDPSVEITQESVEESEDERFEDMSDSAPPIELPPCELSRLEDIS
uniref:PP4R3 EVH1-like domain-containing protein n=1 Tax=Anopheles maculatus TaxID=74869 RepID=A0A182SXV8_9DIPT